MADWIRAQMELDPSLADSISEFELHSSIAKQLQDLRKKRGLSQVALAKLVGTTQSVISRIEDDDYEKHTLTFLRRLALALRVKLRVEFAEDQPAPAVSTNITTTLTVESHSPQSLYPGVSGIQMTVSQSSSH